MGRITYRDIAQYILVFVAIFISAKFGQYLFFEWETSPAVVWPPTGIGIIAIWLFGYRQALPIFLALVLSSITGPTAALIPAIVTTPLAQVAGNILTVVLLRKFWFGGNFSTMRNVMVFLAVVTFSSMLAPTITTSISALTGHLVTYGYISWSRAWAGYAFSSLILVPFGMVWWSDSKHPLMRGALETLSVVVILVLSVHSLFWANIQPEFTFILFAIFFAVHFWVCLRFSSRALTLVILVTTVMGIFGIFLSPDPTKLLSSQLLSIELFLFLVTPIFLAFSALIKERASTINELRDAMNKIEEENVAKSNFIAVLAHELRNPLAPVQTTLEILALQPQEPEMMHIIESAERQVYAMRRLLDDLLDMARVTQGKFELQIERANLCAMLDRCIDTTADFIQSRNHVVVRDLTCDDSIWLDVDSMRFEQVIVNILNNSAKYMNPGGHIILKYQVKKELVEIKITDTGYGISQEHLEEIFEPFWQLHNGEKRNGGGIGVGLSLTRHIVNMHGGTITAESAGVGKGSTFTIFMPLAKVLTKPDGTKIFKSEPRTRCKILVVDDNTAAAESLLKLLLLKGYTVNAVFTGGEVFDAVKNFTPDVIILDIGLPDMTGYEVAKRLRAEGFTDTLVALSGYGQKEDKDKAMEVGFNHHITKPMKLESLEEYLRTLAP